MRLLLPLLLAFTTFSGAAQVTLRQGETGRLGSKTIEVLRVQDRRCGPTENCVADVAAQVRVKDGQKSSTIVVSWPPPREPRWSGVRVVGISPETVTLTDQPPGSQIKGHTVTLRRGESGPLGARRVTLQGWETASCKAPTLCVRPNWTSIYVRVIWGNQKSWLSLDYPPLPAWPGLSLIGATGEKNPALTFTDVRP